MSTLLIVRHGQASFGAADYDQLSELGTQQSEMLGSYWAGHDRNIDAVYSGPAKRHKQTVAGINSKLALPTVQVLDGLAELPAFGLVAKHGQESGLDSFEAIINQWMAGNLDCGELESAQQFIDRVDASIATICEQQGRGKTILVVTSGGPTMAAMKSSLGLDHGAARDLLWVIANSSVSEFRYRESKLSLVAFNRLPHLGPKHVTYR